MTFADYLRRSTFVGLMTVLMTAACGAQELAKVRFGTNWVAEAEHGGFYQAVAEGTYAKYGLDVQIRMGGPQKPVPSLT